MVRSSMVQLSRHQTSDSHRPGLTSQLHPWLAVWPWVSYLTSLCLSFLIHQEGILVSTLGSNWKILWDTHAKSLAECLIHSVHKLVLPLLELFTIQGAAAWVFTYSVLTLFRASQQTFLALEYNFFMTHTPLLGLHTLPGQSPSSTLMVSTTIFMLVILRSVFSVQTSLLRTQIHILSCLLVILTHVSLKHLKLMCSKLSPT